jgi:uncharacterized protein YutE (UPF0331/DUF86 family)
MRRGPSVCSSASATRRRRSAARSNGPTLGESGWLASDLAEALADAASFRNLLVHQYGDVDDQRVLAIARTRLAHLDAFVDTVAQPVGEG